MKTAITITQSPEDFYTALLFHSKYSLMLFIQYIFGLYSHFSGLSQVTTVTTDSEVNQYFRLITPEVLRSMR